MPAKMIKSRMARHWQWPAVGATLVLMGVAAALNPGDHDPEVLRHIYTGAPETWPAAWVDDGVIYAELAPAVLPARPAPDSPEAARVALGERLFEDPALSQSGQFACQSCHNRRLGWSDGLPRSFGHGRAEGTRNAPSLFAAWARPAFFWDGRAASLEDQVMGPLSADNEMANHDLGDLSGRLQAMGSYDADFEAAFGPGEITLDHVAQALAAYQVQLDFPSDLDRFLSGQSERLSDQQVQGLHLFRTKARCVNCHMGPALMDGEYHNIGLAYYGRKFEDLGRYGVTGAPEDAGAFLTPSLRHVRRSGPYMHNGLFPSLSGIVGMYNAGGSVQSIDPDRAAEDPLYAPAVTVSPLLIPLDLSPQEQAALVAFLEAL